MILYSSQKNLHDLSLGDHSQQQQQKSCNKIISSESGQNFTSSGLRSKKKKKTIASLLETGTLCYPMVPYLQTEAQVAASLILMKGGGPWKLASTKFTWGTIKGDWCYTQDIYKEGFINKSHGYLSISCYLSLLLPMYAKRRLPCEDKMRK